MTCVRTFTQITPANPNLICAECTIKVQSFRYEELMNLPCRHKADYISTKPDWSPVEDD